MKKIIVMLAASSLFLFSCGKDTINTVPEVELPEAPEIFLISRYTNYAWGYDDRGMFADTNGDVYSFDFSNSITKNYSTEDDTIKKFDIVRKNTEPVFTLDHDDVQKLYSIGCQIDPNGDFKTENTACDAGSSTISFRDPNTGNITVCSESGDDTGELNDKNAKDFVNFFQKKSAENKNEDHITPLVYSFNDIYMDSFKCSSIESEMYFLSSDEQLSILAEKTELPLDNVLDEYSEYEFGRYVYFVELNAAPADGIIMLDDEYKFSHMEGSGYCNIAAFPRQSGVFIDEKIPCADGGEWNRIKEGDINFDPDFITGEAYGLSEPAMRNVWNETYAHGHKGIYIPDRKQYEDLVDLCDENSLVPNGSIRDILEQNGEIDFGKYALCIKLDSHNDDTKYTWQRTEIGDSYITLGCSISLNRQNTEGECTLAYALIPKIYLSDKNYTVNCLNYLKN